jgi:predicted Zn-dependent protease
MKLVGTFLFALTISIISTSSQAGELELGPKKQLQARKMGLTSKVTHKRLERAYSYVRREQYSHAVEILIDLLKITKDRKDEYGQVWQQMGFILAQKGDFKKSLRALENSLSLNVLPYAQTMSTLYTMAQIEVTQENYAQAHKYMKTWFDYAEEPSADAYILMGTVLSQLEQKEEALKYVNQALIDTKVAPEKWLQFALALNHELKKYDNALKILATLTATYPDNGKYWKQFSATYLSLNEDKKALATMELAYKKGFMTEESDVMSMAGLYLYLNMPRKSVDLIQEEINKGKVSQNPKNYNMLFQANYQARDIEKALIALEEAAKLASDGEHYIRLGMIHLENEKWEKAISAFNSGLKKGATTPEKVYLGMAMAKYQQKDLTGALDTLFKARRHNPEDKSVIQWIDQIKNDLLKLSQQFNESDGNKTTFVR